jgi:glycosyltransferase involved in cell wall biosynthesis
MIQTYAFALSRCEGKYITFCDSDDYWPYPYKLQKQFDYMRSHPGCGLCCTKVYAEKNGERMLMDKPIGFINDHLTFDNLLRGNAYIYAQSYFIRKSAFDRWIDFDKFTRLGFNVWDYPIVLELIQHTKFHCLDFYSAVFVKSQESFTQTRSRKKRLNLILGYNKIKMYFILRYGCKFSTLTYLAYRLIRDLISVVLNRWK